MKSFAIKMGNILFKNHHEMLGKIIKTLYRCFNHINLFYINISENSQTIKLQKDFKTNSQTYLAVISNERYAVTRPNSR